jgi:two-component system sensor histidine kinase MtrB
VRADRSRVAQVLGNLVANAVEHGGGMVEVHGTPTPGGVRLEVVDSGTGFPARGRGTRPPDRGHGLRVAARAVEEAGGRLTVRSGAGGARVSVDLPSIDA